MGSKGYSLDGETIVVNRDLTELDLFLRDFLSVLKTYSGYLIVSGFVSISTGRTRGTEDIDVIVPVLSEAAFGKLFADLEKNGFWCYQGDSPGEVYPYIQNLQSIRFARTGQMFPNMEFIPINEAKTAQFFEFNHPKALKVQDFEFKIPPIEFEILYKELVLGSEKDIADAKHLRTFFSEIIEAEKFNEYEAVIKGELNERK